MGLAGPIGMVFGQVEETAKIRRLIPPTKL